MLRLAASYDGRIWHFALPKGVATLGSGSSNELVLPVPGISKRHVRLERVEGGLLLVDLGSKNGIRVDGKRLERAELRRGSCVKLGRAELQIEDVASSEVDVALVLERARQERSPARDRATTSTGDGATTSEVSPVVALDLIRRIERQGLDLARAGSPELLDSARRLLEGRCLAVLSLPREANLAAEPGTAVGILAHAGELPSPDELGRLESLARNGSPPPAAAHDLFVRASDDGRHALALFRAHPSGAIRSWQLDFFDFLAGRLVALDRVRATAAPHAAGRERELCLPEGFVAGPSPAITRLLESIRATVHSGLDVLIVGETGTGKELVARLVHDSGPTADGPFIAINCAAIPADLLEAELFGVEARVATGVDPRPGLFVRAERGTLFLDEIGDMSEPMQAKLLRALQEREVLPIGAHRPKRVNLRVVSASNKPLGELVRAGRFRADLFYRLRGLQFHLPPLRERKEDIPALISFFATTASDLYGKSIRGVSRRVLELLSQHDWPGNVRELRNEVERAVLLAESFSCLEERHFGSIRWQLENPGGATAPPEEPPAAAPTLDAHDAPGSGPLSLADRVDALEREAIRGALATTRNNKSRAARLLGITRNGLALKLKRLGLADGERDDA